MYSFVMTGSLLRVQGVNPLQRGLLLDVVADTALPEPHAVNAAEKKGQP